MNIEIARLLQVLCQRILFAKNYSSLMKLFMRM